METFLYILFFLSCIVMVVSVLLQPGKTDAGALFTSGVSSAAMNPRGTASVLSKLTIFAATVFMLSALMLSLPALTGKGSVMNTQGVKQTTPATNTNANTANTNSGNTETNSVNPSVANTEIKTDEATDSKDKPADKKEEGNK